MDWLSNILTSDKVGLVLIALFVFVIIGIVLMKMGYLSVHTKGIDLGQDQKTRNLIQAQFEYTNAMFEGVIARLPMDKLSIDKTKWIIARAEDVIQKAIIFNNMRDDEDYIKAKQALVYQAVMKRATNDFFKTDDFKAYCYKFTNDLIKDLVRMKRIYP